MQQSINSNNVLVVVRAADLKSYRHLAKDIMQYRSLNLLVRRVRVNNEIAAMVAEKEFHRSRWQWAYIERLKRYDKLDLDGLKDN